jgi:oligosaccharide reducing-end xylanase
MRARAAVCVALAALSTLGACTSSVDSLGSLGSPDGGGPFAPLRPLTGPATYPNPFRDVLGKTETEIANKISGAFAQLFHGDPVDEAIYFTSGPDAAYIRDILHNDIRTEGMSCGMMVAVELNQRAEFDRLWTYARTTLRYDSGPNQGYFRSECDGPGASSGCVDPYGYQQFAMALIFAHNRWVRPAGSVSSVLDYQADALALLQVMQHKEEMAGGIVEGVTNTFDAATKLPFSYPNQSVGNVTRPSIEMPAYYALWAQATGDGFWSQAATAGRAHWKKVAHPATGLLPLRAAFDGTPVDGFDHFAPEVYRAQINITLDRIWGSSDSWSVDESNRLLQFFASKGLANYARSFSLDGTTTLDPSHDPSLVVTNGASAAIATVPQAESFINEVWTLPTPTGQPRYYTGILDLLTLLILGGQFRVY